MIRSFEEEFPDYSPIRSALFDTLEKLKLYESDRAWEDTIIQNYMKAGFPMGSTKMVYKDGKITVSKIK